MRSNLCRRPRLGVVFGFVAMLLATVAGTSSLLASGGDQPVTDQTPSTALKPTVQYIQQTVSVPIGGFAELPVDCRAGYTVISGGVWSHNGNVLAVENYPRSNHHGWVAGISNVYPQVRVRAKLTGFAVCAKALVPVVLPKPR